MKTEEQIRKELEEQRGYLEHADTRYDYTQQEVIEKVIETLEWVLENGTQNEILYGEE